MTDNIRVAYAWIAAPPVAVLVAAVVVSFIGLTGYAPILSLEWVAAMVAVGIIFLVFGTPLAIAVEMLVGLPAYCLLRLGKHMRPLTAVAIAAAVAAACFTGLTAAAIGTCGSVLCGAACGAAGALAGAVFWVVCVCGVPGCRSRA